MKVIITPNSVKFDDDLVPWLKDEISEVIIVDEQGHKFTWHYPLVQSDEDREASGDSAHPE
jgi:hypothetical protein